MHTTHSLDKCPVVLDPCFFLHRCHSHDEHDEHIKTIWYSSMCIRKNENTIRLGIHCKDKMQVWSMLEVFTNFCTLLALHESNMTKGLGLKHNLICCLHISAVGERTQEGRPLNLTLCLSRQTQCGSSLLVYICNTKKINWLFNKLSLYKSG